MQSNVRAAREHYNEKHPNQRMTQTKLAQLVGISRQHLDKVERGLCVPGVDLAIKLSRILRVKVPALFWVPKEPVTKRKCFEVDDE